MPRRASRRTAQVAAWLVALVVLIAPLASSQAQSGDARERASQRYAEGKKLYASGDYRAAISKFEEADRLSPAPLLDFNIGLAYEQLGDREQALAHYRSYLQRMPTATNRSTVEDKIRKLDRELADERKAEDARRAEEERKAEEARKAEEERRADEMRKIEEARKAEEERTQDLGSGQDKPAATTHDDPALARAAAIDVGVIRDQRSSLMSQTVNGTPQGNPRIAQQGPGDDSNKAVAKPFYKQWWFWVVAGASVLIFYNVTSSGSSSATSPPASTGGATLLRF